MKCLEHWIGKFYWTVHAFQLSNHKIEHVFDWMRDVSLEPMLLWHKTLFGILSYLRTFIHKLSKNLKNRYTSKMKIVRREPEKSTIVPKSGKRCCWNAICIQIFWLCCSILKRFTEKCFYESIIPIRWSFS